MKTTIATVNKLLKENGIDATMYRGNGYYYFMSKTMDISSLYENCISNDDPMDILKYVLDNTDDYNTVYRK